jgi:DNA-binding Lrp family transcriptional regulator
MPLDKIDINILSELQKDAPLAAQQFSEKVGAAPTVCWRRLKVLECYPVMGDADYMLKIAVPNIAAYNTFLQGFLFKVPGIATVESSLAPKEAKNTSALQIRQYFNLDNS